MYVSIGIYANFTVLMFVFYFSENCVFGVPLTTLLQTDQQRVPHTQIPLIMEEVQICFNPPPPPKKVHIIGLIHYQRAC